ncbi:reverse transcriptase domain-containing protein [Dapis sp. BLCC M229]|uniref:reverse transcriptase domain-containing protein n=1 Tax=Dapis sp. BLCC M229 TaxID=3400188 RepID=UPI003CF4B038
MNNPVSDFILDDLKRTLFPLNLTEYIAKYAQSHLSDFINKIYSGKENFNPQIRVYSDKPNRAVRRTLKLDPVAEWYIYDIAYKYRKKFRLLKNNNRCTYGYIFRDGKPVPGRESYQEFKKNYRNCRNKFQYSMELDIANYFNSIYHHDLENWFKNLIEDDKDTKIFGQFLRQINTGRSIDCLPQGIYPCKMILQYIDYNGGLRSKSYLRFMDDFALFDNDQSILYEDLYKMQILLGNKGLSINEAKLKLSSKPNSDDLEKIDDTKVELLKIRVNLLQDYDEIDDDNQISLTPEQRDFILDILSNDPITEEDAELTLTLMGEQWEDVFDQILGIAFEYPNLAKSCYNFFQSASFDARESVARVILQKVKSGEHLTEYQLFWMAKMCEDFLMETKVTGELLHQLYEHRSATDISRAKLLEIQSSKHGLPELRQPHLTNGSSTWLSWCAAIGSLAEVKAWRNHYLQYFKKASTINCLIGEVISGL